jgi:hypothetical protein
MRVRCLTCSEPQLASVALDWAAPTFLFHLIALIKLLLSPR